MEWHLIKNNDFPAVETEVIVCAKRVYKNDVNYIITNGMYEDGTVLDNDSIWCWEDIDYAGWDENEDCGIIPQGWFECKHYNPDGVLNYEITDEVIAWMPLPSFYTK